METTREGIRRKLEGREKQRANVEGHGVGFCNRMKVGKGLGKLGRRGGGEITRIMEIVKLKMDGNENDQKVTESQRLEDDRDDKVTKMIWITR